MRAALCHPDRVAVHGRKCRECRSEQDRAYRTARIEQLRASKRAYYEANRDSILAKQRATLLEWPEALERARANARRWGVENREKATARARAWLAAHPERARAIGTSRNQRRRARLRDGCSPGVTPEQWHAVLARHGYRCAYCNAAGVKLTRDHIVPIAVGGRDEPSNIAPACASCNKSKGAREMIVWLFGRVSLKEGLK